MSMYYMSLGVYNAVRPELQMAGCVRVMSKTFKIKQENSLIYSGYNKESTGDCH